MCLLLVVVSFELVDLMEGCCSVLQAILQIKGIFRVDAGLERAVVVVTFFAHDISLDA